MKSIEAKTARSHSNGWPDQESCPLQLLTQRGGYANCGNYPPVLKETGLYSPVVLFNALPNVDLGGSARMGSFMLASPGPSTIHEELQRGFDAGSYASQVQAAIDPAGHLRR